MSHQIPAEVSAFTEVNDDGLRRYLQLTEKKVDIRLTQLNMEGSTYVDMEVARDCYVLGLFHASAVSSCKALEEDLAWQFYKKVKDEKGVDEARRSLGKIGLPRELFDWAIKSCILPVRAGEEKTLDVIRWVRAWGAHADCVIGAKVFEMMQPGGDLFEGTERIRSKRIEIPDYIIEIAKATGIQMDPEKPGLGHLMTDEAALNIFQFVLELLERMHQDEAG
jgi:hypothetical protein